jgi:hypothetical protein
MGSGFLGYPSTLMLDVVVCVLLLVVPTLLFSLYLVKFRRNYLWHRNLQITLGALLLVTVALFETDMRLQGGWEQIVNTPTRRLNAEQFAFVKQLLYVHLVFAVTTPVLWGLTLWLALRRFGSSPAPGPHSRWHKPLGWISVVDITLTSLTGLAFYYFAFMA